MAERITIIFSSGRTLFQRLVQLVSLDSIDHVSIGIGDKILHARDRGVVLEPRAAWFVEQNNQHIAEFEVLPDVSQSVLACLDCIGQPYDKPGVLRVGLGLGLRRSGSMLGAWPASPGSHTCAAFALMLDPHGDLIPEWAQIARRDAIPSQLFDAIGALGSPSFRRIVQPLHAL